MVICDAISTCTEAVQLKFLSMHRILDIPPWNPRKCTLWLGCLNQWEANSTISRHLCRKKWNNAKKLIKWSQFTLNRNSALHQCGVHQKAEGPNWKLYNLNLEIIMTASKQSIMTRFYQNLIPLASQAQNGWQKTNDQNLTCFWQMKESTKLAK